MFNLSADGTFPRKLSVVRRRHGSPYRASMATSGAGLVLNLVVAVAGLAAIDLCAASLGISSFVILGVILVAGIAVPL
ncbi:hypothetical protein SB659_06610 [Arthrobacter sp. SIMBA_036]|uniref:hypothetical protein n=1 Tax=Arthrobacter sp. SIMBA_036 TaxID=3085778 RepID=UPI00397E1C64